MSRKAYPSDVSDEERAFVAPYLRLLREDAPQREHSLREVFNGLRWIIRTGAQWRMMPHDLPNWKTVYPYFRAWRKDGTWARMNDAWREKVRSAAGRQATPSAGSIDSQSVKTSKKGVFEAGMVARKSRDANGTLS